MTDKVPDPRCRWPKLMAKLADTTQWGDEVAAKMRAYYEANKRQKYVEGTADNLMIGLLNIALPHWHDPADDGQRESSGFFYVEWVGKPCPWCHAAGVSGKSPEGHFFAGCPDPDCLAHNLAYDFVTVDHARAAWDTRALTNTKDMERE